MNTSIEKPMDYRCFLLGIVVCWIFDSVWAALTPFLFALEAVLNPIAVVIGKSILYLVIFYLLFRKPKKLNIKWIHIAILGGFLVLMNVLDFFLVDRFYETHSLADNRMDRDITNYMLQNVRKWANLVTSLLTIGFLWWCYDSENAGAIADIPAVESRGFYGGILFSLTFNYILFTIDIFGNELWCFVHHPILEEVIVYMLLVFVTVAASYLLVKKHTIVFPLAVILAIVVVHIFAAYYLGILLFEQCTPNIVTSQFGVFFDNVANCCNWVLPLMAFVLYRKELEQQNE